ncbi:hypothetical protein STEG23_031983, partial [Scotinomys teguina]
DNGICDQDNGICDLDNGICDLDNGICDQDNAICEQDNGIFELLENKQPNKTNVCGRRNNLYFTMYLVFTACVAKSYHSSQDASVVFLYYLIFRSLLGNLKWFLHWNRRIFEAEETETKANPGSGDKTSPVCHNEPRKSLWVPFPDCTYYEEEASAVSYPLK